MNPGTDFNIKGTLWSPNVRQKQILKKIIYVWECSVLFLFFCYNLVKQPLIGGSLICSHCGFHERFWGCRFLCSFQITTRISSCAKYLGSPQLCADLAHFLLLTVQILFRLAPLCFLCLSFLNVFISNPLDPLKNLECIKCWRTQEGWQMMQSVF